jgi:hypothetical protein
VVSVLTLPAPRFLFSWARPWRRVLLMLAVAGRMSRARLAVCGACWSAAGALYCVHAALLVAMAVWSLKWGSIAGR